MALQGFSGSKIVKILIFYSLPKSCQDASQEGSEQPPSRRPSQLRAIAASGLRGSWFGFFRASLNRYPLNVSPSNGLIVIGVSRNIPNLACL
jgi:hypothetical protein